MDLSRRRFLGMLGLAPVIPLVAPTKAYSFLGNILRPVAPKIGHYLEYLRISTGKGEDLFTTKPGITSLMYFPDGIDIEDVIARYGIQVPKDTPIEYRMNFAEGGSQRSHMEFGVMGTENPPLKRRALIVPQNLDTDEARRGKDRWA